MSTERERPVARWLNLLIPGGGLILIGRPWFGLVIALAFTVAANLAIAVNLLFPDDFTAWMGGLTAGLAAGVYIGAQLRFAQTLRTRQREAAQHRRRAALRSARECLLRGQYDQAWGALRPLAEQADHDLLVAYRVAEVLTAKRDVEAALFAWTRVRRLDTHRIYREQIRRHERSLGGDSGMAPFPDGSFDVSGA